MKTSKSLDLNDFLISFLLHVIILFGLSFIIIKQSAPFKEMAVDWLLDVPVVNEIDELASSNGSEPQNITDNTAAAVNQNVQQLPVAEKVAEQVTTAKSIEPPVTRPKSTQNTAPLTGVNSAYLSGIKAGLSLSKTSGNGYELEGNDGSITVLKSVLPNPKINDYGKVTLLFKINNDGTVNSDSVIPLMIDDPIYTSDSIKALVQWTFSFKKHDPDKEYRISFIFKPE
jgi:hypothetical protein